MTIDEPQGDVPYCGEAPLPAELAERWNLDPLLLAALAVCVFALWRLAGDDPAGKRPLVVVAAALATSLFVTPFCALSSALFSARVVHHIVLTALLAPLVVFSFSQSRVSKAGSLAAWTMVQAAVFWAWHAPALYAQALSNDVVYWAMQISLLAASVGFWLALRRAEPVAAVGALLGTTVQMGLLGALITLAGRPLYGPHLETTSPWGLSALADQQLAGLIMWVPAAGIYLVAALLIAARWLKAESRMTT